MTLDPLNDYADVCWFPDVFSREEIAAVLRVAEMSPVEDAMLGTDRTVNADIRRSRVRWVNVGDPSAWIFQRLGDLVAGANTRYRFDLSGFHEGLQVAEYGPGSFFNWHKDHGPGAHTMRKLSITVQLSDESDYEGGDMEFLYAPRIDRAPKAIGTAIVFPSYVMHRVAEVTAGTRRSIVTWITGPPYR